MSRTQSLMNWPYSMLGYSLSNACAVTPCGSMSQVPSCSVWYWVPLAAVPSVKAPSAGGGASGWVCSQPPRLALSRALFRPALAKSAAWYIFFSAVAIQGTPRSWPAWSGSMMCSTSSAGTRSRRMVEPAHSPTLSSVALSRRMW